jgi:HlyD family secretion protein
MKKLLVILVLAAAAAGTGAHLLAARRAQSAADTQAAPPKAAVRGAIREEVSCDGSVVANLDVEIKSKASGEVIELPYDIGDPVKKGDLLMSIDPVDEERNVRQAEVRLEAAEAKLARAKRELEVSEQDLVRSRLEADAAVSTAEASRRDQEEKTRRLRTLLEKEYASREEVDTAETASVQARGGVQKAQAGLQGVRVAEARLDLLREDIKLAAADVEVCQIDLQNAQQRLLETKVYAPVSGVISDRLVQRGQIISSPTMNVGGGTALLIVSDLSRVFVMALVDESDMGKVAIGQEAEVTVDAFPDIAFRGRVVRLAIAGDKVSNVVTFEAKVEVFDARKTLLRPEMTADIRILAGEKADALLVPCEAVLRDAKGVYVNRPADAPGAPPVRADVTTGMDDGEHTEILSGLNEGDPVLVVQTVKKEEEKGLFSPPPGPPPGM